MLAIELYGLLRHMAWADALVWNALLSLPAAQRDFNLLERLHHLHSVQWAYLQIWRGEAVRIPDLSSFTDFSSVHAWVGAYYRELPPFVEQLRDFDLKRQVEVPWADEVARRYGSARQVTLAETALQVVLHTTHHRGQVATRLRELGGEPPLTDFIAWLWMGKPVLHWERI